MTTELEHAWSDLLEATPAGWYVGRPSYHDERGEWLMYAFDPSERAVAGVRKREWTAIAATEVGVVREMARCLREISEAGRQSTPGCLHAYPTSRATRKACRCEVTARPPMAARSTE